MKNILQKIADWIIYRIDKDDKEITPFYYELGLLLEKIAIKFNVELK